MVARAEAPGTSTSTAESNAAAIAEQRRQEAARQAAEEARRRAEAAREAARRAQEAARQRAREAAQAKARAERAEAAAEARQRTLRSEGPGKGGENVREARETRTRATELRTKANEAEQRSRDAHREAMSQGDRAIRAEREANDRAAEAGTRKPYAIADRVENTQDAGSLSREDQRKLFGTRSVVTPREAAQHDAGRVERATNLGPEQGARELETQLRNNDNPEYRRQLVENSKPSIDRIAETINRDDVDGPTVKRTMTSLSNAADLAGPEGGREIAGSVVAALPDELGDENSGKVTDALADLSRDPKGARFGAQIADRLSENGLYEASEGISNLTPELKRATHLDAGERAAEERIRVNAQDVKDERSTLESDRANIDRETRERVDEIFDRADNKNLPDGVEATVEGDRAEIVRRDERGRVVERQIAIRDGEQVRLEETRWNQGTAQRQIRDTGGEEGTVVRNEQWKEKATREPSNPTTDELIARAPDEEGIKVAEQKVRQNEDGHTVNTETYVDHEGRRSAEQTYRTQTGGEGIHGEPESDFDLDEPIEVIETRRTEQKWGEEEKVTNEDAFSQGNVRAVAVDVEGDDVPKQWTLEKQLGAEYRSQTFVEDAPDFTTITIRRAQGSTVTEDVTSRGIDEDENEIQTTAQSTTTFGRRGEIQQKHVELTDEEGVRTEQDYRRDTERTAEGLRVREQFSTTRTEPGEPPKIYSSERDVRSLEVDGKKPKVTSIRETLRAPGEDGQPDIVTSQIDRNGQQIMVNGKPIPLKEDSIELDRLSEAERELAAQTTASTISTAKDLLSNGKDLTDLTRVGAGIDNPYYSSRLPRSTQDLLNWRLTNARIRLDQRFGVDRVNRAFELHETAGRGARGLIGVAGLAASGASFVADIQDFNAAKLAIDAGGIATSGAGTVAVVKETRALRAGASSSGAAAAAGKFATFAKFGGVGVGTAASGYQVFEGIKEGDGTKIAQGGVGVVGTIGAFAAGGAVGGPPGVAVGLTIGVATFGVQWAIGKIFGGDDEPKVAEKEI